MRLHVRLSLLGLLMVAVSMLFLTSCGTTSVNNTPVSAVQHLYVGNDNGGGTIRQFLLPIANTSTATADVAFPNSVSVGVDFLGDVAGGNNAGNLSIFNAPVSSTSTAAATFKNGAAANVLQIAFNSSGDLFATSGGNNVNLFLHPLSNASTVSQSITNGALVGVDGCALDGNANLFVTNTGGGGGFLAVFAPPYTGAPTVAPAVAGTAYRKMKVSSTQAFVCSVAPNNGQIDVYNLPLTNTSAPAFSIVNGMNFPEAVALDSSGNLYAGNLGNSTVTVYSPPFSAASAPVTTLTVTGFAIFGIEIGL